MMKCRFAFFLPLIYPLLGRADLGSYGGPNGVGTIDIEVLAQSSTNITDTTFKNGTYAFRVLDCSHDSKADSTNLTSLILSTFPYITQPLLVQHLRILNTPGYQSQAQTSLLRGWLKQVMAQFLPA
jgi:hypothetical protein